MNRRMAGNISISALFLAASLVMLWCLNDTSAQSRSASINLEGTEWVGAPMTYAVGSAMGTLQCSYIFEAKGRASYKCLAIQSPGTMAGTNLNDPMFLPGVDNPFKPKLVTTPGGSAMSESLGRYTQSANLIHVEFADAIMNIIIKDNVLSGETVYKDSSKGKEKWAMQKTLNRSAVSSNSTNVSSPLSLSQFQIDYFKPTPLTKKTVSGITARDKLADTNFYSFLAGSGEVTITINLTARQDSFADSASIQIQDRKSNILTEKFVITSRGRTNQAITSISVAEKQAVLLRIMVSGGGASYEVRLDGAVDFGQPGSSSANAINITRPTNDALSESQALLRGDDIAKTPDFAELSRLDTYKAATKILYRDKEIIGTLVLRIKSIDTNGKMIAEIKGEEGLSLNGTLVGGLFSLGEIILEGNLSIDFGTGIGTQRLRCDLRAKVGNRVLTRGEILLGIPPSNLVAQGEFIRAEPIK